jgi:hypothetical protein
MPTTYLSLLSGTVTGAALPAADWNKAAAVVDRTGGLLYAIFGSGRLSGWTLTSGASTVTSGAGQVGACWCKTTAVQAISGLASGSTNYVFAKTDAGSPASGTVDFVARLTSAAVTNTDGVTAAVCLGSAHYVAATGLHAISTGARNNHLSLSI